jgi:hypothetical protein
VRAPVPAAPSDAGRASWRPRWRALLAAGLLLALSAGAWAQQPGAGPADLPLEEVASGAAGYGLTEGPGGVERFEVEVLAVQEPSGPGFPTLLVRTEGPFLERSGGVAAGMSGSPVYLGPPGEERLAGALAYAFPGGDHRLALVTPIAAMRALAERDAEPPAPPGGAAPLATPLLLSGVGPRSLVHLEPLLARLGHRAVPVQAGSGADVPAGPDDPPLAPGAAVAVALAHGEVAIAAVGTVTDVRGEEVLLLGHPLLRGGPVDHALLRADVTAIVANRDLPYKLANLRPGPLGRVVRDGRAGLAARLDGVPDGLPVTVRVDAPGGARTVTARLSRDPALTPSLLATVVQQAVDTVRDRVGGGSAELAWEIGFRGEPPIRLLDQRVEERDLATEAARLAAAPLAVLLDNPFQEPDLARVSVRVGVHETPRDVELVEVALETPEVAPGGTVQAFVRLQPWRGAAEVRTLAVELPDDVPPGPLTLTFRGASVRDPEAEERRPPPADPLRQPISGLPPVLSWAELLSALESRPQARELLVEIPGAQRPRRLAREDLGQVVDGLERVTVTVSAEAPSAEPGERPEADGPGGAGAAQDDEGGGDAAEERR